MTEEQFKNIKDECDLNNTFLGCRECPYDAVCDVIGEVIGSTVRELNEFDVKMEGIKYEEI